MNAKNVVGFLLCKSAFTQRNVTSILLVVVFFAVYILAGGKISTSLPELGRAKSFGSPEMKGAVDNSAVTAQNEGEAAKKKIDPRAVLGLEPTEDRAERENAQLQRGRFFTQDEAAAASKPVDSSGLIQGNSTLTGRQQALLKRNERKQTDSLSAIEERLNIKRR